MVVYHFYILVYVAGGSENFTQTQAQIGVTIYDNGPNKTLVEMGSLSTITWSNKSKYTWIISEPDLSDVPCTNKRIKSRQYTIAPNSNQNISVPSCSATLVYKCVAGNIVRPITIVPAGVKND